MRRIVAPIVIMVLITLLTVIMPAGSVEIELKENDSVVMTGPVETCFAGYLPVREEI